MKTIIAASLLGILSTASYGAAEISPEGQTLLNQIKANKPMTALVPSGIAQYEQDIKNGVNTYNNELAAITKDKGWDPAVAQGVQEVDAQITQMQSVESGVVDLEKAQTVANFQAQIEGNITSLQNYTPSPPTSFPEKCVNYKSYPAVGNAQPSGSGYNVTLCFDASSPAKLISCNDPSRVAHTAPFGYLPDAGTQNGEGMDAFPPPRNPQATVYMNEAPQLPAKGGATQAKVQCYVVGGGS